MIKLNLTYFLYGAIVFTDLAWVFIGVLLLLALVNINPGPLFDNRILIVLLPWVALIPLPWVALIPLPWVALIGFSWLSHAFQRRGQSEAAWEITFVSLTLWVLYALLALYVAGLGILLCTYHANC